MHRPVIGACGLLAALATICGCASARTNSVDHSTAGAVDRPGVTYFPVAQREPVPNLTGRTLAGKALTVRGARRADMLVVNVWAAWCVECRAESQALADLSRRWASRGVRFLGIDEQDNPASARSFARRAGAGYPSLVDTDGKLLAQLVVLPNTGIPSTLVVDRSGRMAGRIVGQAGSNALAHLMARISAE